MKLAPDEILNAVRVIPLWTTKKGSSDEARIVLRLHPLQLAGGVLCLIFIGAVWAALARHWILHGLSDDALLSVVVVINFYIGAIAVAQINLDFHVVHRRLVCAACGYEYDPRSRPEVCSECGADCSSPGAVDVERPWRPRQRKVVGLAVGIGAAMVVAAFVIRAMLLS